MPPHALCAAYRTAPSSPLSHNKAKTRAGAERGPEPETFPLPTAPSARQQMLEDSPDCTILQDLKDITDRYVPHIKRPGFDASFESVFPQAKLKAISSKLRGAVRAIQRRERTIIGDKAAEKDLTNAWVRAFTSHWLYFVRPNHACVQSEVNADYGPLCPGYSFHLSENAYDSEDKTKSKVDASLIPQADSTFVKNDKPNWSLQRYSLEFKRGGIGKDPFDDREDPETENRVRVAVRGQLLSYVACIFTHQHRTAHFMFFVNGGEFRFMRWDRSGVIVSKATDYVKTYRHTEVLLRLLYGLSELTAVEAGLDWTAIRLSPNSCGYKQMRALSFNHNHDVDENQVDIQDPSKIPKDFNISVGSAPPSSLFEYGELLEDPCATGCQHPHSHSPIPTFNYIREAFRRSLDSRCPLYLLKVSGHDYLIGRANFSASGPIGRGTRGYVALHWKTQRFAYLKDTWRPHYVGVGKEADVLAELNAAGVQNVPTLIHHEDIKGQETETSQYAKKSRPVNEDDTHATSSSDDAPPPATPATA